MARKSHQRDKLPRSLKRVPLSRPFLIIECPNRRSKFVRLVLVAKSVTNYVVTKWASAYAHLVAPNTLAGSPLSHGTMPNTRARFNKPPPFGGKGLENRKQTSSAPQIAFKMAPVSLYSGHPSYFPQKQISESQKKE